MTGPTVRMDQLGRGRRWAERAVQGERIAVLDDEGREVAWIVPATEEITTGLIAEFLSRHPQLSDEVRQRWREELQGLANAGWRYHRARDCFVPEAST